jgi:hypothetical protein
MKVFILSSVYHLMLSFLREASIDDQLLTTILVLATLGAGVIFVYLLFVHSRRPSSMMVRQILADAIEKRRFEEQLGELAPLKKRLEVGRAALARIELEEGIEEDPGKKAVLEQRVKEKQDTIEQLRSEVQAEQERIRSTARGFAEQAVEEAISRPPDTSDLGYNRFFLEFTTVIVIIVAIIVLGVLGILGGNEIAPLLGSIAGYVLGRTSRNRDQIL